MLTKMILMLSLLIALMRASLDKTKDNIQSILSKELAFHMLDQSMATPLTKLLSTIEWLKYKEDELIYVIKYSSNLDDTYMSQPEQEDKDHQGTVVSNPNHED